MKKISVFLASGLLAMTLLMGSFSAFSQNETLEGDSGGSIVKGLKGKINGVDTCHCPDDAGTCYCSQ